MFATLTLACPSLSQLAAHTSHDVIAPEQLQKRSIREDNTQRFSALNHMLPSPHVPDPSTAITMMYNRLINQIPLLLPPSQA